MEIILLDPRPASRAAMLGRLAEAPTIGVEVTVPELAHACAVNLDGQHGPDADGTAAITIAADIAADANWLDVWHANHSGEPYLPALLEAARLGRYATIRPDRDSLGAIAVMTRPWSHLGGDAFRRIHQIAQADSSAPRTGGPQDPGEGEPDAFSALGFLAEDRNVSVERRVSLHWQWISTGTFEGVAGYLEQVRAARAEVAALAETVTLHHGGRVAAILTNSRMGVVAAYRRADIVIAEAPAFRWPQGHTTRKITVCAQPGAPVDLDAVAAELNAVQPGWGGQQWVKGSPQAADPAASLDEVLAVVGRHLAEVPA